VGQDLPHRCHKKELKLGGKRGTSNDEKRENYTLAQPRTVRSSNVTLTNEKRNAQEERKKAAKNEKHCRVQPKVNRGRKTLLLGTQRVLNILGEDRAKNGGTMG